MRTQVVNLGKTESGIKGLFTDGTLAMSLDDEQWALFNANWQALDEYCERMGFVYDWGHDDEVSAALAKDMLASYHMS